MLASFFFTFKRLLGQHVPNLIDVDRRRAGSLMTHSHLSDPQLLLVDLDRLEPRIDE